MASEKSIELTGISSEITKIKQTYSRLGPIGKFFFPSSVANAIDENKSDNEISDAITRGTWFVHRLFFPELGNFKLTREPYENIEDRVESVTEFYNSLNSFRKFFFPRSFKKLMTEGKNPSALEIASALHTGTLFYHKFFFPSKLGRYFSSRSVDSTRWLFDPQGIPAIEVGKGIENNLNELEGQYEDAKEVNYRISEIGKYFKDRTFIKFIVPNELRVLLENEGEPNRKIRLTQAVFGLPWYYNLLLGVFYPSMLKNFKKSNDIKKFYEQIQESTILKGDLRVERNIKTLAEIAEKAREANKSPEEIGIKFSDTLDYDMANLISSLNHQGNQGLNAQTALDLIRVFGSKRTVKNDTLYLCDALTLYFKNYPKDNGNEQLRLLVEDFKTKDNFPALYTYLRQERVGLFKITDTARNRQILDAIRGIHEKGDALVSFEILYRHHLISSDNSNKHDNFNTFIKFQANQGNQLNVLNNRLLQLEAAITTLSPDSKIEQTLFDFFMVTQEGTTIPLIERVSAILTLMSQSEDAEFKKEAYPLLLGALKDRRSLGSTSLAEYMTKLHCAISALSEQQQLNISHLKLLLAKDADPTRIKDELLASVRQLVVEETDPAPSVINSRVEATTNSGLLAGLLGAVFITPSSTPTSQQLEEVDPYSLAEEGRSSVLNQREELTNAPPKAPAAAEQSQVSAAYQQIRSYAAPVLGFSASYASAYAAPFLYQFVLPRTGLIGMGLVGSAITAGYANSRNITRYTGSKIATDVLPGGAPSQVSTLYQQAINYAVPGVGFLATYAGASALPVVYSFFADRAGFIAMGLVGSALAIGYTKSGDITAYAARVSANMANYAQPFMRKSQTAHQTNNKEIPLPPPPPPPPPPLPPYDDYYHKQPDRQAIQYPMIEDAHEEKVDYQEVGRELDAPQGPPEQPAAPQNASFLGLSVGDINGYSVYARYAGAAALTLGTAYALYQDPTKTLLGLAGYVILQPIDVQGGINRVRNFSFFRSAAPGTGTSQVEELPPSNNTLK